MNCYFRMASAGIIPLLVTSIVAQSLRAQNHSGTDRGQPQSSSRVAAKPLVIHHEANVNVSADDSDKEFFETVVSADPSDPQRLLGCSMFRDPKRSGSHLNWTGTVTYVSSNGGIKWRPTLKVESVSQAWDPSCTFGGNGDAYFLTEVRNGELGSSDATERMWLFRSTDKGDSWGVASVIPLVERPFVTVGQGSQYKGRIYISGAGVTASDYGSLSNNRSSDNGATFRTVLTDARTVLTESNARELTPAQNVVLSDGTYVVAYSVGQADEQVFPPTKQNASLKVVTSSDGGDTFSSPIAVTQIVSARECVPSLAADQSDGPFRDRLYLVWADYGTGRGEILLAYSDDKGKRWSRPVVVNDDRQRASAAAGPHNTMPTVAVNRDGVVGVMWYDRREHRDNEGYWVRFAASLDGGETFSPSLKVSDAPASFDRDRVSFETFARFGMVSLRPMRWPGHTAGLAATADGIFHPFWVDNRTGRFQIWTTRVVVSGRAIRNGTVELSDLEDITRKVRLNVSEARIDWARLAAAIDISITNLSGDVIVAPVMVRVLSLRTMLGAYTVAVTNADNGVQQGGAVWKFTNMLNGGRLRPHETSKPRKLMWKWINVSPSDVKRLIRNDSILDQKVKVLGRIEK